MTTNLPILSDHDALPAVQDHFAKWSNCTDCKLHQTRTKPCLAKGCTPCDFLFLGEAPSQSDDIRGLPFTGPAGNLLKAIINTALHEHKKDFDLQPTYAITNLVACVPNHPKENIEVGGTRQPYQTEVEACSPRLEEFINICKPKGIVYIGDFATTYLTMLPTIKLVHPARILAADDLNNYAPIYLKQINALANFFDRVPYRN